MEHTPAAAAESSNILAPDVLMVILTWVTFFILFAILKKFAWKPILDLLQKREDYIRKSLDDADKAKAQLSEIEAAKAQILNQAKAQAAQIVDDSRKSARDLAHDIEAKAKASAQDLLKNASAQMEGERHRVAEALKRDCAQMAILLAGKILKEDSNTDKNKKLVEEAIKSL